MKVVCVFLLMAPAIMPAQIMGGRNRQVQEFAENSPYDGRFTFVRIRYSLPDYGGGFRQDIKWGHDYPRVLPKLQPIRLTTDDRIFDAFFRITNLTYNHPYYRSTPAEFWGYFEDNDRSKRMLAIVNYNNDVSEYWEFSDEGMFPLGMSNNEAYKPGVNYLIYALTR